MTDLSQHTVVERLAVQYLTCKDCGAKPGERCIVMVKNVDPFGLKFRREAHQVRRQPFEEAWSAGYQFAEDESVRAHG